jgi:hypothetical protein
MAQIIGWGTSLAERQAAMRARAERAKQALKDANRDKESGRHCH